MVPAQLTKSFTPKAVELKRSFTVKVYDDVEDESVFEIHEGRLGLIVYEKEDNISVQGASTIAL